MSRPVAPKAVAGRASSVVLAGSPGLRATDQTLAFLTLTSGPVLDVATLPGSVAVLLDASIAPDTTRRVYVLRYTLPGGGDPTAGVSIPFTGLSNYVLAHARLRDVDEVTPVDVALTEAGSRATATSGGTLSAPGFDPSMPGTRALYLFMKRNVSTSLNLAPQGDKLVTLARCNGDGSVGGAARLCTELFDDDTPVAARTATTSDTTNGWVAATVVVRPKATPVTLRWEADAETADFSAFLDTSASTGGIDYLTPQTRSIVPVPAGAEGSAYQFAINGTASNSTQRCESRAAAENFVEGDDRWFAGRTFLPSGFPTNPTSWQLIMQLKNDSTGSPPLELDVVGSRFELAGGFGHPDGNRAMPPRDLGAAVTDTWADWVWHVRFSTDPAVGEVSIWRDGALLLDTYRPPGGTLYPGQISFLKVGIYRDPAMSPTGATVVHDNWRVGTTRAAVDPPTPAAASPAFLPFLFPDRLVVA